MSGMDAPAAAGHGAVAADALAPPDLSGALRATGQFGTRRLARIQTCLSAARSAVRQTRVSGSPPTSTRACRASTEEPPPRPSKTILPEDPVQGQYGYRRTGVSCFHRCKPCLGNRDVARARAGTSCLAASAKRGPRCRLELVDTVSAGKEAQGLRCRDRPPRKDCAGHRGHGAPKAH